MTRMVTFMASGAMTIEGENEDEIRKIFEQPDKQEIAWNELKLNGIDITEISETDHK